MIVYSSHSQTIDSNGIQRHHLKCIFIWKRQWQYLLILKSIVCMVDYNATPVDINFSCVELCVIITAIQLRGNDDLDLTKNFSGIFTIKTSLIGSIYITRVVLCENTFDKHVEMRCTLQQILIKWRQGIFSIYGSGYIWWCLFISIFFFFAPFYSVNWMNGYIT